MTRAARRRLEDILEAIDAIRSHVGGSLDAPRLDADAVRDAVGYRLIVIGEAVKALDDQTRAGADDVPWQAIAKLRDFVAHRYFQVDPDVIEDTVRHDLAPLEAAVRRLLG